MSLIARQAFSKELKKLRTHSKLAFGVEFVFSTCKLENL